MDCRDCFQKKRADYWHRVACALFAIIGGVVGGIVGIMIIKLLGGY